MMVTVNRSDRTHTPHMRCAGAAHVLRRLAGPSSTRLPVARLVVAGVLMVVVLCGGDARADAHAMVESTEPVSGAILSEAPKSVVVRFSEEVVADDDDLRVLDAKGRRVDEGRLQIVDGGRSLRSAVHSLRPGGYALTWRVVSADGHPVRGAVTWRVGTTGSDVEPGVLHRLLASEGGSRALGVALALQRAVVFGGLLVFVGGGGFVLGLWPHGWSDAGWRRLGNLALLATGVAGIGGIGLEAANVAGLGLGGVTDAEAIGDLLGSDTGRAALARLGGLAALGLLGVVSRRSARGRLWTALPFALLAVGTLGTLGFAGHARTGRWSVMALPLDVVHLMAASAWIGGLVVLVAVVIPRLPSLDALRLARRFAPVASCAVLVIVATGTLQAVRRLDGGLEALRDSDYGHLLAVKIALVALLVGIGAKSRSLITSTSEETEVWSPRRLHRAVGAEAALGAVVVVVTALLVASDPGVAPANVPFSAGRVDGTVVVDATLTPARSGPVAVHLQVSDPTVALTTPMTASATLALPEKVPPISVPLVAVGPRHWVANRVEVPMAGTWRLTVHVVVNGTDDHQVNFDIDLD